MPGMNSGVNVNDPTVIAAFSRRCWSGDHRAADLRGARVRLDHRAGMAPRGRAARRAGGTGRPPAAVLPEPSWRRLLRVGFGLIWVFDGILQAQPEVAIGLPSQVIQPTAASSPHWVQRVVNSAGTSSSYHPMQAGAASVWIRSDRRLAAGRLPRPVVRLRPGQRGLGLVVSVLANPSAGSSPPACLAVRRPRRGAHLLCGRRPDLAAGRAWHSPLLGRAILGGTGLFLVGMAVLQAWPGHRFWQGISHRQPGILASMTQDMAQTPQPRFLSTWVNAFPTSMRRTGSRLTFSRWWRSR